MSQLRFLYVQQSKGGKYLGASTQVLQVHFDWKYCTFVYSDGQLMCFFLTYFCQQVMLKTNNVDHNNHPWQNVVNINATYHSCSLFMYSKLQWCAVTSRPTFTHILSISIILTQFTYVTLCFHFKTTCHIVLALLYISFTAIGYTVHSKHMIRLYMRSCHIKIPNTKLHLNLQHNVYKYF